MTAYANPDNSARTDVLFYVQHLLGIGHLQRATVIARALDRAGLAVTFVTGGVPVPDMDVGGARVVQLPALRTRDESFSALVDGDGRPVDDAWKAARAAKLRAVFDAAAPAVLLIEMFPFGRRQMRFELLPLLDAARARVPRPRILCSLRDVLTAQTSSEKTDWMLRTFETWFDLLLVHGDPSFLPLERTFPRAAEIADRVRYTGYVVAPPPTGTKGAPGARRDGEVLVSTGGGAVAAPLIEAALGARAQTPLADAPWRILVGHNLPEDAFQAFRRRAPAGVTVERARPDFRALLARARLSISQAGYNTVLEVLAAGVPAVVVPFAAGAETEQSLRARLLAERGALTVVAESDLSADTLAQGVRRAFAAGPGPGSPTARAAALDLGGAEKTAQIIRSLTDIVAR